METTWPAALAASFFFIFGVSSSRNFCMAVVILVSSSVRLAASVRPSHSLAAPPEPVDVGLSSPSMTSISASVGASAVPV